MISARKAIKSFLPRTLFGRSLLILIVPIVIIQLVSSYVFFNRHWNKMIARMCDTVASETSLLISNIESSDGDSISIQKRLDEMTSHLDINAKLIPLEKDAKYLKNNVLAKDGWERYIANILVESLNDKVNSYYTLRFDFKRKWVYLDVQLDNYILLISLPERRVFSSSGYIYLLWVFASALILLLTAIMFMRNQIRPIRKLAVATDRFGRGHEIEFFKPEGAKEVRQAGAAFLEMSKRIRKQLEQRGLMLAGISHDLRTPITRLRLALSMTEMTDDTQAMNEDLNDMELMINGYLSYVRGEGDELEQSVSLDNLIENIVNNVRHKGISIDVKDLPEIFVLLRPVAISRALSNILENAVKYANKISLTMHNNENGFIIINIDDNGPGVSWDNYDNVFKPFFRGDKARSTSSGSVGLGLSIALDIISSHGGSIDLSRSEQLGGLSVTIKLPE